jgi:cell wall surface anchor family protein
MKKKKLKVQVAALAMTGAIAAAPLTVRAEEASTTAPATASTSSTEASATAAAPAVSTATTPAVSGTTGGASTATASTPATGTAATAGTGATATGAGSGASTGTSTEATAGTGATASTGTAATATTEASAPTAPVTVAEAPADPATTVPNNVDTVVPDDNKQGTDIVAKAFPIIDVDTSITPEEAKGEGTIGDKVQGLPAVLGNMKNKAVVMQGDLSIAKDNSTDFDSTGDAAHEVNKEDSYSLKADLDVNAVNNAINASAKLNFLMSRVKIDTMETGLRSTFEMGRDLEGSFHLPTDLEDAKKHYELSSADGSPMMYRINYANSSFAKDKVSIVMDLDLSKYDKPKPEISTFGKLNNLINKSAKKIQLIMKGIKFNAAHGNVEETETATEKTTTAEGTIRGTLVGYMKADVSLGIKGKASYVWGAIQNEEGRDFVAGRDRVAGNDNGNNKVDLTVKMTTVENKIKPVEPIQPEEPVQPVIPVTPVAPSNGGGNTPSLAPARPSSSTPSNPGTVLGESRPTASTPSGEVLGENRETPVADTVEKKQGAVLGESRPSVKGVSDRASVATGDYNFTGLWASLFGISLAALAGFVVLQKKKEN